MTFLAPGFLYAALAVAAAIGALHFLVTRQPRAAVLPTARFVPNLPATATSRAARPADILLLLLRILLVLAVGAALAGPTLETSRAPQARVILADFSASVEIAGDVRDSVRSIYREGDLLIAFDSSVRTIGGAAADTLSSLVASPARGNLSAAMVSAIRAGSELRERADSLELVIVSPFATEEWDAATDSIRKLWPGRAMVVRAGTGLDAAATREMRMTSRAAAGDPLLVTASLAGEVHFAEIRLVRDSVTADDIQWATTDSRVLVAWPVALRPPGTVARAVGGSGSSAAIGGGVVTENSVVIAAFERKWEFNGDSIAGGSVTARWVDGEPAVVERQTGNGCVRSVAIPVAETGDLAIRAEFVRLMRDIVAPCRADARPVPVTAGRLVSLAGAGGLATREEFRARGDVVSVIAPWLVGLALLAAIAEVFLRRRGRSE